MTSSGGLGWRRTRRACLAALAVVGCLSAVCLGDQRRDAAGWNGTKWGMKPAEVKAVFPSETFHATMEQPDEHGFVSTMALWDYNISGMLFRATFTYDFETMGLRQVALSTGQEESTESCRRVELVLEGKYGPADTSSGGRIGEVAHDGEKVERRWFLPSSSIVFLFSATDLPKARTLSMCLITYSQAVMPGVSDKF